MALSEQPNHFENVSLIVHADWSKNPGKRWAAYASLQSNHRWKICELSNIHKLSNYFHKLKLRAPQAGCVIAGFDFPIGFPFAYAVITGISDFLSTLPLLGQDVWKQFYIPASSPTDISLHRPFYPEKPGHSKRFHLEQGLDIPFGQLYRLCEKAHRNRRAACPLFWTMGGQQVGKAAICGWRDLLSPSLTDPNLNVQIWPFSGELNTICLPGNIVVVETYPAEFYSHLGLISSPLKFSKRRLEDRMTMSSQLIAWSTDHDLDLHRSILEMIASGFGNDPNGEDKFDALVGLYGMINVIMGSHPSGEPVPPRVAKIEGWIFGQEQPT